VTPANFVLSLLLVSGMSLHSDVWTISASAVCGVGVVLLLIDIWLGTSKCDCLFNRLDIAHGKQLQS